MRDNIERAQRILDADHYGQAAIEAAIGLVLIDIAMSLRIIVASQDVIVNGPRA